VSNSPTGNDEFDQQVRPRGEPSTRLVEERVNGPRNLVLAVIFVFVKRLRFPLALGVALLSQATAFGTTRYVAQSAGTFNGGSACNGQTAITVSTLNSTTLNPGDVTYFCGTITAPAGSNNFISIGQSGTSGNPITFLFDAGAVITAAYWSGPVILIGAHNYITINGQNTGTIQATANGTNFANQQDNGTGVDCGSVNICSNIIVENLTIANLYVHACSESNSYTACTDAGGGNTLGIRLWGGTNDTISGNTVHDVHWAIVMLYGSGETNSTNLLVYNNTTFNHDHGIVFADQGANSTATGSNCSNAIYNNDIGSLQPWDQSADYFHHDAIHAFANNAPSAKYYVCVYSNYLHGDGGVTFNSFIFMESDSQSSLVFNNVLNLTGNGNPTTCTGTGILGPATGSGTNGVSLGVYNNTIVAYSTSDCIAMGLQEQTNPIAYNNIATTANEMTYVTNTSGQTWDYNTYYNTGSGGWQFGSFASWQNNGYDAHGQNANPDLTASFTLNSGSPAIGAAKNLTSLGISALDTGAPQTFGAGGSCGSGCNPRTSSGAWDAGAYPYGNGNSGQPNPPTGLTAVVN
jgi:hypothetical protein